MVNPPSGRACLNTSIKLCVKKNKLNTSRRILQKSINQSICSASLKSNNYHLAKRVAELQAELSAQRAVAHEANMEAQKLYIQFGRLRPLLDARLRLQESLMPFRDSIISLYESGSSVLRCVDDISNVLDGSSLCDQSVQFLNTLIPTDTPTDASKLADHLPTKPFVVYDPPCGRISPINSIVVTTQSNLPTASTSTDSQVARIGTLRTVLPSTPDEWEEDVFYDESLRPPSVPIPIPTTIPPHAFVTARGKIEKIRRKSIDQPPVDLNPTLSSDRPFSENPENRSNQEVNNPMISKRILSPLVTAPSPIPSKLMEFLTPTPITPNIVTLRLSKTPKAVTRTIVPLSPMPSPKTGRQNLMRSARVKSKPFLGLSPNQMSPEIETKRKTRSKYRRIIRLDNPDSSDEDWGVGNGKSKKATPGRTVEVHLPRPGQMVFKVDSKNEVMEPPHKAPTRSKGKIRIEQSIPVPPVSDRPKSVFDMTANYTMDVSAVPATLNDLREREKSKKAQVKNTCGESTESGHHDVLPTPPKRSPLKSITVTPEADHHSVVPSANQKSRYRRLRLIEDDDDSENKNKENAQRRSSTRRTRTPRARYKA